MASVKDADQAVKWYCGRWQIETFHKILKSGCTVEDCRLQNAERPQNYIAMMSVIAWRLHWMTYINRCEPHQPCTVALTTIEWQALFMCIHNSARLPDTVPSVRQAVRAIHPNGLSPIGHQKNTVTMIESPVMRNARNPIMAGYGVAQERTKCGRHR